MGDDTLRARTLAIIAQHFGKDHVTESYRFGADLLDSTDTDDDMRVHFDELRLELEIGLDLDLPDLGEQLDTLVTVGDVVNIVVKAAV